jgi:hypothetical protein
MVDRARDAAQQIVTAFLHGDRERGVDIAVEFPSEIVLALMLADLVAYVHHTWSVELGVNRSEAWVRLLADLEAWRANGGGTAL